MGKLARMGVSCAVNGQFASSNTSTDFNSELCLIISLDSLVKRLYFGFRRNLSF